MLRAMPAFAYHFVEVAPQGAAALAATLAVFACLIAAGRWIVSKDPTLAALLGWSIIYLFALASSLLGIGDLRLPLTVLPLLTVVAVILRRKWPPRVTLTWWSLLLAMPVLLLGSLMPSLYWDSDTRTLVAECIVYVSVLTIFPLFRYAFPVCASNLPAGNTSLDLLRK